MTVDAGDAKGPFGAFGQYRRLTLHFDHAIGKCRILAQDLASDEAVDITKSVQISGGELVIPGSVIDKIGLSGATPGDLSDPGMVFVIQ